jgi:hypothetical protein
LPCTKGAGKGPESPGRLPAAVGSPAGTDEGGSGGLAQEASKAVMAIIVPSRMERFSCTARIDGIQGNVMALLLLEALGALLLLVFIVWWTMFSGRKNGELKEPEPPAPGLESDKK